jgi:hypothetical protein
MTIPIQRHAWLLAGLGVTLVFLLLNSDLLSMHCILKWDAWYLFWPLFSTLASHINTGHLPLWEPSACCGFPFHADPLTGTFYPVLWLVGWLLGGGLQVYQTLWLMHWLWAILGCFFLLKRMGCSPPAAFSGCMVFGFSGFFVGQASHTVCIMGMSHLPWILLLMDEAMESRVLYALPAGILFGFLGLGGYPGLTVYTALMIVAWGLLRYGVTGRTVSVVAITLVTGTLVLSPSYASFLVEGRGYTDRVGSLPLREACHVNRFPFPALISLVVPGLTVAYPALFDTSPDRVPLLNGYCGIFGLLCVLAAAATSDFRRRWSWLLWFMVVALLLSMGSVGGLSVVGYYLLPPFKHLRHPSLVKIFWTLGAAILAGHVFDRLTDATEEKRRELGSLLEKLAAAVLYVAVSALLWAWLATDRAIVTDLHFASIRSQPNSFAIAVSHTWPQVAIIALFAAVIVSLRTTIPRSWIAGLLVLLVVLDAAAHLRTNKYTVCWNGKAASVSAEFEQTGRDNRGLNADPNQPRVTKTVTFNQWAFDRQSYIRAYLAPKSAHYDTLVGDMWAPSRDTKFLKVLEGPPRFWLTPEVSYCEDNDSEFLSRLADTDNAGPVPVCVHCRSGRGAGKAGSAVKPGSYGHVQVIRYEAESVLLHISAPDDCWLFGTERYAAGWRAQVDGNDVELCRADFCFRALQVPRGTHVVRMEYEPWIWKPLLAISWGLSFVVLAGWGAIGVLRRHRGPFARSRPSR